MERGIPASAVGRQAMAACAGSPNAEMPGFSGCDRGQRND